MNVKCEDRTKYCPSRTCGITFTIFCLDSRSIRIFRVSLSASHYFYQDRNLYIYLLIHHMIFKDKETGYESRKYVCRLNFPFYDFFCYGLVKSCKNYSLKRTFLERKAISLLRNIVFAIIQQK